MILILDLIFCQTRKGNNIILGKVNNLDPIQLLAAKSRYSVENSNIRNWSNSYINNLLSLFPQQFHFSIMMFIVHSVHIIDVTLPYRIVHCSVIQNAPRMQPEFFLCSWLHSNLYFLHYHKAPSLSVNNPTTLCQTKSL